MKKQNKLKQKMMRMYNPVTKSYYKIRRSPLPPRPKKDRILTHWAKKHKTI
jgi:hypothetical protein